MFYLFLSPFQYVLSLFLSLTGLGYILALPVLVPSVRRWLCQNREQRIAAILLLSLTAFLTGILMLAFLGAQLGTLDRCYELPEFDDSHCGAEIATWFGFSNTEDFRLAIAQEQFWRIITPPPLRQDCYAGDQEFCEFVDADSSSVIGINWLGLLLCFWPSLVTGWSVWGWTRPSKPSSV